MRFEIAGETPAKKNSRVTNTNTGRTFPNPKYTKWHDMAQLQVYDQKRRYDCLPVTEACRLSITFVHGDLRRRDSDNAATSILDLLKDCGVLHDDNWQVVRELHVYNAFDKKKPCAYVEIEGL